MSEKLTTSIDSKKDKKMSRVWRWSVVLVIVSCFMGGFWAQRRELCQTSLFQSFDIGGIYFRAVPSSICKEFDVNDIKFFVQPPRTQLTTPPVLIQPDEDPGTLRKYFDPQLPTAVYIHGFFEGARASSVRSFRAAFLARGGYNILLVDWRRLAEAPWYVTAVRHYPRVAEHVALMLRRLLEAGAIDIDTIHLIGFSLGAHLSGVVGRILREQNMGTVSRVTALDPALLLVADLPIPQRLHTSSAKFVDVIHTCGGLIGIQESVGHADFYPNSGSYIQPGCLISLEPFTCSHWRSWRFFMESVQGGIFQAKACDTWSDFAGGKCDRNSTSNMGLAANTSAHGSFYLRTRWHPPYDFTFDPDGQ